MHYKQIFELVFRVAQSMAKKGPGWAQQTAVLTEVAKQIPGGTSDERTQQLILTCWQDLFRCGLLSWGYNIDNPDAPFYHVPDPDPEREEAVANLLTEVRGILSRRGA